MRVEHKPELVAYHDPAPDTRLYGDFAYIDNGVEIHMADGTVAAVIFDPEERFSIALDVLGEDFYRPADSETFLWETPEQLAAALTKDQLEYAAYAALRALEIQREDEVGAKRAEKDLKAAGNAAAEAFWANSSGISSVHRWERVAEAVLDAVEA